MLNFVFTLEQRSLPLNLIRQLFCFLDWAVYSVYEWATVAVFDLSKVTLSSDAFENFSTRIYVIIGIFMLFKVTITLLGYLVDPDKINDKTEGLGKIIGRTIVSICMLVGLPFIWNFMFQDNFINGKSVNDILLEAVPRIIIGRSTSRDTMTDSAEDIAKNISWNTYKIVFYKNGDENARSSYDFEPLTVGQAKEHVIDSGDTNAEYKYHYMFGVGTLIGGAMAFVMISIAIDVAVRVFKLIILRLLAPIPILSYILPKSSKDGGTFNNWVKSLISTWLDLFIKLGVIYFILFMIDNLISSGGFENISILDGGRKFTVITFLIIGLLFFAKQAPKFITDLLGIKNKEGGLGFGKALTAGAIGLGAIGSAAAGYSASKAATLANGKNMNFGNRLKAAGAGLFGAGSGIVTGVGAATSAKDHSTKAAFDAMTKKNSAALTAGRAGSTFMGRTGANLSRMFTGQTAADRDSAQLAKFESEATAKKQLFDYIMDKGSKAGSQKSVVASRQVGVDASGNAITREVKTSYSAFNSAYQNAIQSGSNTFSVFNEATGNNEIFETNNSATGKFLGDLQEASATEWAKNNRDDSTLQTYERVAEVSGGYESTDIKKQYKNAESSAFELKNSTKAAKHKADAGNSK